MRRSKAGKFSDKAGRRRNCHFSGSESDDYASSHRAKFRGKGMEPNRRGSKFDGRGSRGNRNNFSDDDFDGLFRGARGGIKSRGSRADEFSGRRNDRRSDGSRNYKGPGPRADEFNGWRNDRRPDGSRNYKSPRAGKLGNNQRGRFNSYKDDRGGDSDDFRNRKRVIER